jgi:hypothetical protein
MVIAVLVVLAVIVVVAVGRGGELSQEPADYAPLDMGPVSATDIVLLRPPTGLWGYSMQVTDEALERIAAAVRERDVRIVALEQRIADLTGGDHYAPVPSAARHARRSSPLQLDVSPADPEPLPGPGSEPRPAAEPELPDSEMSEPEMSEPEMSGPEPHPTPDAGDQPDE